MTIFNVIVPIFTIIVLGYIAGTKKFVSKTGAASLNQFVFYIALPALLFKATATAPLESLFNWSFIIVNLAGISTSFLLAFLLMKWRWKNDHQSAAIYGMNASYGTTGYMGIPLLIALLGNQAALPAAMATLLHNIPVILLVLIICESHNASLKERLKPIFTNPLTISVGAGLLFSASGLSLPPALMRLADLLGNASGATALFAIGLGLVGQSFSRQSLAVVHRHIYVLLTLKLLVQPLVVLVLLYFVYPLDSLWAMTAIVMSALPVGAGVYVFAQKYNRLEQQTALAILLSIVISLGTISLLLYQLH